MRSGERRRRPQQGYLLVVLLFAIAIFGLGVATVGRWESEVSQREHEEELVRVGAEVVAAIGNYYRTSPGYVHLLPSKLDELLDDDRFIGTVHHLRRIPLDPFSHRPDWTILRDPNGSIVGIASQSGMRPLRRTIRKLGVVSLPVAEHYSEWKFQFDPSQDFALPQKAARNAGGGEP